MEIFRPGWTFSPVERAESSSQASYKILSKTEFARITWRKFQPGLPGWNFSPVWATRDEIFNPVVRTEISHVMAKRFQPGLKIHKRMRRTLVYSNKYKKQRFPPSHSVLARAEISHVIVFFFPARSTGLKLYPGLIPCNQPLSCKYSCTCKCPLNLYFDGACVIICLKKKLYCILQNLKKLSFSCSFQIAAYSFTWL